MAALSESKVNIALVNFLKAHDLQDNIWVLLWHQLDQNASQVIKMKPIEGSVGKDRKNDVDEIVLQYVISILEDLGDSQNAEENIDVDQFIDVMDAYIPGFKHIESVQVCEWMFELAASLSKTDSPEANESEETIPLTSSRLDDRLTVCGAEYNRKHLDSQGESERSTSESSQEDIDDQLQMILEMFPQTLKLEVEHCYHSAERDLDRTVQLILHRQDTGAAITEETLNKSKDKKKKNALPVQSKAERDKLIQRYAFIDVDEDKKTYRPPPPKTEPKKLVRYLDGQVVNTKGQKYTEIKKEDEEEMKKTYVNLKPARKYRFH